MTKFKKYHTLSLLFFFFFPLTIYPQAAVKDTGNLFTWTDSVQEINLPDFISDPAYLDLLKEGLSRQAVIDSLSDWAVESRKQAGLLSSTFEKCRLQNRIEAVEDSVIILESEADSIFRMIADIESGTLRSTRPFLILDTIINGIKVYHYDLDKLPAPAGEPETLVELIRIEKHFDTTISNAETSFMIMEASPYSEEHYFDSVFIIPEGIFYWIQLAAFSNPPDPDYFGGIWPVTMVRDTGQDIVRYYAGRFTQLDEARRSLGEVKRLGMNDAFIIGYYNRQKMSVTRVEQYELKGK